MKVLNEEKTKNNRISNVREINNRLRIFEYQIRQNIKLNCNELVRTTRPNKVHVDFCYIIKQRNFTILSFFPLSLNEKINPI